MKPDSLEGGLVTLSGPWDPGELKSTGVLDCIGFWRICLFFFARVCFRFLFLTGCFVHKIAYNKVGHR